MASGVRTRPSVAGLAISASRPWSPAGNSPARAYRSVGSIQISGVPGTTTITWLKAPIPGSDSSISGQSSPALSRATWAGMFRARSRAVNSTALSLQSPNLRRSVSAGVRGKIVPSPSLDARVANLGPQPAEEPVDRLARRRGGRNARGAQEALELGADVGSPDGLLDDLRVAPRHLGPRSGGGEAHVGEPADVGRQSRLDLGIRREVPRLEGEPPPAGHHLLAKPVLGKLPDDVTQRQSGRSFHHQPGVADRHPEPDELELHRAAVEERRLLAERHLPFHDGSRAGRGQRRAQDAPVLEKLRLLGHGGLGLRCRIEQVHSAIRRKDPRPQLRTLLIPGGPVLVDLGPLGIRAGVEDAVDRPADAGRPAVLVIAVARFGEEDDDAALAAAGVDPGSRLEDRGGIGGERLRLPGRGCGGLRRGRRVSHRCQRHEHGKQQRELADYEGNRGCETVHAAILKHRSSWKTLPPPRKP